MDAGKTMRVYLNRASPGNARVTLSVKLNLGDKEGLVGWAAGRLTTQQRARASVSCAQDLCGDMAQVWRLARR